MISEDRADFAEEYARDVIDEDDEVAEVVAELQDTIAALDRELRMQRMQSVKLERECAKLGRENNAQCDEIFALQNQLKELQRKLAERVS